MEKKNNNVSALILAGGLGTRMKSEKPKVLHEICGETLLKHVILNVEEANIDDIGVVVGYKADMVKEVTGEKYSYYLQEEQLGTGHAVMMAKDFLKNKKGKILVLCGDAPLINKNVINDFINYTDENSLDLCVLTAILDDAKSYGRIVRKDDRLEKIVELKDANEEQANIKEVNSGTYIFDVEKLLKHLDELSTNNAQKEYYITDMIEIFKNNGYNVDAFAAKESSIVEAANNRYELSKCEELLREEINKQHMLEGVTIINPKATYIDRNVKIGVDTVIYPNTIIKKGSIIGERNEIYASRIENSCIGDENKIDNCVITDAKVSNQNQIGPYVHLRPNADIKDGTRLGNFVEVKNSTIGNGTKVSHLTYVGDGEIGENTNVGCGVVFVNYDGKNKYKTKVGNNCFVGCNVNLVAPITIEDNVYIAAGSTLTDDVEKNSLAIARSRQTIKKDYKK
ncbi:MULTISPECIES: bifunctional UDP-N-acetylglucosamine diphosphorylase/glucosamine-1-phosphate N-acetyltransferase GlmU [Anaerofustis]|uniref:bifunctional UDP-N-acetylglucosamine diphosphorylase/glucosamine-1-phosphate N-acetyltransferase GlmU n=1 Tax=Anaerofustis TaxID=264995 RepID=UPI0011057976|nr:MULTISPECIES: bifunctional UDP-N-acetylglucosamine diphosphorylase/glucosamine-1-phosphate N-acetyltransferase GlmU [Anaerofustis]MCO8194532.1 bifunctional UDP-N-acetylglucosamine diphosphorylase/glucosamine-1-phosphate N-acetyltransferase GlmU [Anaerofustis sp. NSJ-163]